MTRLVVHTRARIDFRTIIAGLRSKAGDLVAESYRSRFEQILERLIDHPESGVSRPALGARTRIAVVQPYVVIYDYLRKDDTITILRIMDGRRDIRRRTLRSGLS
jgi:plasmid stabilization system protein ParE